MGRQRQRIYGVSRSWNVSAPDFIIINSQFFEVKEEASESQQA